MNARDLIFGPLLAALVVAAWAATLWLGLAGLDWSRLWPLAPLVIAVQCWLYVGIFIIVHDAIHGTLVPGHPRANRVAGRVLALLYAGFSFDRLAEKHHAHHRHSGTAEDPDFSADHPIAFWPWYREFFATYFGLGQVAVLALASVLLSLTGLPLWRLLTFWALPSILSSLQLFYFGTYLPHRHEDHGFADQHNARSLEMPWLLSLLTCFHFGHHHTHHARPGVPWWRLPRAAALEGDRS
ncbi:fatty acid desaturase [Roseobacter sp. HKCCA0434]|uniref:fatty acid desaturase n=1 Tax=Roseobacter sp. HKCCA0434 TaxID=3079297 RepID=UPI002905828A|nr:fatty acid desaturase [Roseobacter sp. HKCCA0434]